MTARDRYLAWRKKLATAGGCSTCRAVRSAVARVFSPPPKRPQ